MLNWIEPRPKRHLNRRTLSKFKIENSKKYFLEQCDSLKSTMISLLLHILAEKTEIWKNVVEFFFFEMLMEQSRLESLPRVPFQITILFTRIEIKLNFAIFGKFCIGKFKIRQIKNISDVFRYPSNEWLIFSSSRLGVKCVM